MIEGCPGFSWGRVHFPQEGWADPNQPVKWDILCDLMSYSVFKWRRWLKEGDLLLGSKLSSVW